MISCPLPFNSYPSVQLAHGGGGKLSQQLVQDIFLPFLGNEYLSQLHDGAIVPFGNERIAFTTDSYVINPIFFPGGDIGALAVNGTVNDLAMCGATPRFLSAGFIIEEGFPMEDLQRIAASMQEAAALARVVVVTGDTKVVDRGKADKIFITTAGIGEIADGVSISPMLASPGDVIILSGRIAQHGIAIMSVREGLRFETDIVSDCAALNGLTSELLAFGESIHVLRDPTRGGIASALNEIAAAAQVGIWIEEEAIPVADEVRGACEILGFDPLYVANEGKLIAFVAPDDAAAILEVMQQHPLGKDAVAIGQVVADHAGTVIMKSRVGGKRVVDMLSGEQLPRIC
ncbi:MAG: hydrogenase expression/formation protein HypE [Ignavibacteriales bacterium]|nr:hydrogenase expression/formation protein HypE [Ignavibacteriales bacterium]